MAELLIFLQYILWESCSKLNFEQLSHSMFCKNIVSLAVAKETYFPWIRAKQVIFLQNILWENCLKFNFKQISHDMYCKNIDNLAVTKVKQLP